MNRILLSILIVSWVSAASVPSTFDLRVLPYYKPSDFTPTQQGICIGANWARTISQTLSHIYSAYLNRTVLLSAQQLLECAEEPALTEVCHYSQLNDIEAALQYVQRYGITTEQCYPNQPDSMPGKCSLTCTADKQAMHIRIKATSKKISQDISSVTSQVGNVGPVLMALQYRDSLNYYTNGILNNEGSRYGVILLEVVGWKDKGETLLARSNFGGLWGSAGYAWIKLRDPTVKGLYAFNIDNSIIM